jgi:hypothetical protein
MNMHLAEIATKVASGAQAALLVDQAGWHMSARLVVPPNITIVPLPPKCPELNPQENVWQTVCSLPVRMWLVLAMRRARIASDGPTPKRLPVHAADRSGLFSGGAVEHGCDCQ